MDDALFVRGFEGIDDLLRNGKRPVDEIGGGRGRGPGRVARANRLTQRLALDQFHNEGTGSARRSTLRHCDEAV